MVAAVIRRLGNARAAESFDVPHTHTGALQVVQSAEVALQFLPLGFQLFGDRLVFLLQDGECDRTVFDPG